LLDELPSLDEGGRTAYDPVLMILLSACTTHAGYGHSGDGHALLNERTRRRDGPEPSGRIEGAWSRPCDAQGLSWRGRSRSCTVGTTHRSPGIRPVGCTHPTGPIGACQKRRKLRRPESRAECPRLGVVLKEMSPSDFAQLMDAHAAPLVLYARQWCDAPEDAVQDAFLKLVRQRRPPEDVVAWLYRVVRNGALDAAKVARRRRGRESAAARPVRWFVEPEVDGLDAETAVAALEQLVPEQREVIVAHHWVG